MNTDVNTKLTKSMRLFCHFKLLQDICRTM